jgi:transcriptional regulator with XRE-family HTH domain
MISEMIKSLRENAGYSQSELAKKLDVTRSSVNAWEMDLSIPTTPYIVEMAKLFHVSTDYILGIENAQTISLDGYSDKEIELVYKLIQYFDENK